MKHRAGNDTKQETPVAKRIGLVDHLLGVADLALNSSKDDEVKDEAIEIKRLLRERKEELQAHAA